MTSLAPRVVAIPLDDRPVNLQALRQLAAVAGVRIDLPPRALLGRFSVPGDPELLLDWLEARASGSDSLLLSVDMLCYGGLVASRDRTVSLPRAIHRLERLEQILTKHRVPTFATSVVLRQSITVTDESSLCTWRRVFDLMSLPDEQRQRAVDLLSASGDPLAQAIALHLDCRRRNHQVNLKTLAFVATNRIDHLLFLKEDCAREGPHRIECEALVQEARRQKIADRVALHPGTDEGGLMLLAKALLAIDQSTARLRLEFCPDELKNLIPLYEDRPLRETLTAQIDSVGLTRSSPSDLGLLVVGRSACGDLFASADQGPPPYGPEGDRSLAALVEARALSMRKDARPESASVRFLGLADVGYANGADPELAPRILRTGLAPRFAAFAAWNTAANTTGSALAHLVALLSPGRHSGRAAAQIRYLLTRWIDDYVYQTCVRPRLLERAAQSGLNPHNLGSKTAELLGLAVAGINEMSSRVLAAFVGPALPTPEGPHILVRPPKVRLEFPWGRLFEIEIELEDLDVVPAH